MEFQDQVKGMIWNALEAAAISHRVPMELVQDWDFSPVTTNPRMVVQIADHGTEVEATLEVLDNKPDEETHRDIEILAEHAITQNCSRVVLCVGRVLADRRVGQQ